MKRIYFLSILLLLAVIIPIILWFVQPQKQLQMAIIDKTVVDDSYREHQGVVWALNHLKYNTAAQSQYHLTDYYGALPKKNHEQISVRQLPNAYENQDVIYVADTYGVYKDDQLTSNNRFGRRSEKLYGGLEQQEWDAILNRLTSEQKSVFIAEFNTIASPTSGEVRQQVLNYLEMDWTGWVGRYFNELDFRKNNEIPQWIVDDFGDNWDYRGGGFVLVNDFTYEIVVLEDQKHVKEQGIRLKFTKEAQKRFGVATTANYEYWFDIVKPRNTKNIIARYDWDLTKAGQLLLEQKGIPKSFAAVIGNQRKQATSYYFAGDFNDVANVPLFYKMQGLTNLYRYVAKYADDAFYWSAYMPLMETILAEFEQKEETKRDIATSFGYNAKINGKRFEVLRNGKWEAITFKGVNIGMGKPGYFPGEAAITEEQYTRWFEQIAKMNANTIRVYTLNPPDFYKALAKYNKTSKTPLYVLHGIWAEEEPLEETLDAFNEESVNKLHKEMRKIVKAIHGDAYLQAEVGHASGLYDADVSEYVIGWIVGIEWYPYMVENTNKLHHKMDQYQGTYFKTKNASAFEYWLAKQMDYLLQYEKKQYHWMRPISFTNWTTTDMLKHPSEPNEQEDLVGVNPNHIYPIRTAQKTGYFAAYHTYPYYPDFMNYDQKYLSYVDHRGEKNSYAGYLEDLYKAHKMPVIIAEFGIPASRGLTHKNPFGWNQGFVSEKQQGEILRHLYEDIIAENYLGGFVFSWHDEWFKRTWNTMDYDHPERRAYWSNAQTNEQQFGLLSFDQHKIQVDGNTADWKTTALYQNDELNMHVDSDERYLYVKLEGVKVKKSAVQIVLDTVPSQGKKRKTGLKSIKFSNAIDFVVELDPKGKDSRIVIDPYYDYFSYLYGYKRKLIHTSSVKQKKVSTTFIPIQYVINKELYLPKTKKRVPFQVYETGKLMEGNGNPEATNYNSLADYTWSKEGVVELRIPWLLLQAKDPSRKEFMGHLYKGQEPTSVTVKGIGIGVILTNQAGTVTTSAPHIKKGVLMPLNQYTWDNWDIPTSKERLKQSYYIMQETYKKIK